MKLNLKTQNKSRCKAETLAELVVHSALIGESCATISLKFVFLMDIPVDRQLTYRTHFIITLGSVHFATIYLLEDDVARIMQVIIRFFVQDFLLF